MAQSETTQGGDLISGMLRTYAQNILVFIFGLLPLIFIPSVVAPFEYTKVFVVFIGVIVALVLFSLSTLRQGSLRFGISYPVIALWSVVAVTFVSALLSGDVRDALVGDVIGTHSVAFLGVLALAVSVWVLLDVSKKMVLRLYMIFAVSTLVLVAYHLLRLAFGPDFLSFGIFTSAIVSPIGSWNDLALFLGLSVILSLVTLEQLTFSKRGRILFSIVTVLALFMLGVINFFLVWVVLGLTSLAMVVYGLIRDRYTNSQLSLVPVKSVNMGSLTLSLVVFAASVLFIIGGSSLGGLISKYTNISYIEVRPSLSATLDIARDVYSDNAFFGIGPNRFMDAWRLHKDTSINQTVFWNTDFVAGNGYLTSFFITSGVLGGLAWLLFLGLFLYFGMRLLITAPDSDPQWYFIGVSSFVSAVYIWGMSIVYVPGAVMLLIGAICTGVMLTAYNILKSPPMYILSVTANRRVGFIFALLVVALIVGSVSLLYTTGRHYASAYTFTESTRMLQEGSDIGSIEQKIMSAYNLSQNDVYLRRIAEYQFQKLTALFNVQEPTQAQQDEFNAAVVTGIQSATEATKLDPTESANWAVLGAIYSTLVGTNEGVYEKANEALTKARELNPNNPLPYLELAILDGRTARYDEARANVDTAISLKPNFTDGLFYLSQLDIMTGNVEGAIRSTQSIIAIEPQNPGRYYQLGVLLSSNNDIDAAITAFEQAVALDTNYANARYLLALAYDIKGRTSEAKAQLEKVLELNPGNSDVQALIDILNGKGSIQGALQSAEGNRQVVNEAQNVQEENGTVTTGEAPDTPLVTPVNTAPSSREGAQGEATPSQNRNQ